MAIKPTYREKTVAEKQQERRAELDWQQQMEAQRLESIATQRAEHDAFLGRAQKLREDQALARAQGETWIPDTPIPTIRDVFAQKAAEERAAAEEAERQRIANLSPREVWLSTLNYSERQHIATWERVNRMPYPVQGIE